MKSRSHVICRMQEAKLSFLHVVALAESVHSLILVLKNPYDPSGKDWNMMTRRKRGICGKSHGDREDRNLTPLSLVARVPTVKYCRAFAVISFEGRRALRLTIVVLYDI